MKIGALKTVATTLSLGIMMKTAVESGQEAARKISLVSDSSPSASRTKGVRSVSQMILQLTICIFDDLLFDDVSEFLRRFSGLMRRAHLPWLDSRS